MLVGFLAEPLRLQHFDLLIRDLPQSVDRVKQVVFSAMKTFLGRRAAKRIKFGSLSDLREAFALLQSLFLFNLYDAGLVVFALFNLELCWFFCPSELNFIAIDPDWSIVSQDCSCFLL